MHALPNGEKFAVERDLPPARLRPAQDVRVRVPERSRHDLELGERDATELDVRDVAGVGDRRQVLADCRVEFESLPAIVKKRPAEAVFG
jgi:hypothetical protein